MGKSPNTMWQTGKIQQNQNHELKDERNVAIGHAEQSKTAMLNEGQKVKLVPNAFDWNVLDKMFHGITLQRGKTGNVAESFQRVWV